ncbi:hypothetical protein GEMRC1_002696 [Eukaryota sp. GEM-RC1]
MNHNLTVSISGDVATRFNSTYLMLKGYFKLLPFINYFFETPAGSELLDLKSNDTEGLKLKTLYDFLYGFFKATKFLSGEQYVTVSLMTSIWNKTVSPISIPGVNHPAWLRSACSRASLIVAKYAPFVYNCTTFACMFLDPRFIWQNMCPQLKNDNQLNSFKQIYEVRKAQFSQDVQAPEIIQEELHGSDDEYLASLQDQVVHYERDEMERYQEVVPIDMTACPLSWWKNHKSEFVVLASLARDFLAIPATSVPCERVFSLAGNIKNKKRSRLGDDSFTSLTLLKDWLEKGYDILEVRSDDEDEDVGQNIGEVVV